MSALLRCRVLAAALAASCGSDAPPVHDAPDAPPAAQATRVVVDTRDPATFAAGHDPGAINLQWGWDQLESRVHAYLPEHSTPLAVRAESAERAEEARALLVAGGYADVVVLEGEPGSATLSLWTVVELEERLAGDDPPVVIDVRTPREWERGVIEGAVTVEQDAAPRLVPELDPEAEYAVICAGGYRSGQLASLLRARGFERVHNVVDGMKAWYARH